MEYEESLQDVPSSPLVKGDDSDKSWRRSQEMGASQSSSAQSCDFGSQGEFGQTFTIDSKYFSFKTIVLSLGQERVTCWLRKASSFHVFRPAECAKHWLKGKLGTKVLRMYTLYRLIFIYLFRSTVYHCHGMHNV